MSFSLPTLQTDLSSFSQNITPYISMGQQVASSYANTALNTLGNLDISVERSDTRKQFFENKPTPFSISKLLTILALGISTPAAGISPLFAGLVPYDLWTGDMAAAVASSVFTAILTSIVTSSAIGIACSWIFMQKKLQRTYIAQRKLHHYDAILNSVTAVYQKKLFDLTIAARFGFATAGVGAFAFGSFGGLYLLDSDPSSLFVSGTYGVFTVSTLIASGFFFYYRSRVQSRFQKLLDRMITEEAVLQKADFIISKKNEAKPVSSEGSKEQKPKEDPVSKPQEDSPLASAAAAAASEYFL